MTGNDVYVSACCSPASGKRFESNQKVLQDVY